VFESDFTELMTVHMLTAGNTVLGFAIILGVEETNLMSPFLKSSI
jgi:hypothetical protein